MKLAHIADTHFGKDLKKINFADKDQPFWLERFLEDIQQEGVEVVLIAGDIYDDKVPSIKAQNLFSEFLERLNDLNITVFITPGNHDQADRLAVNGNILRKQNIYYADELSRELFHKEISLANGEKLNIWLLPYVEPLNVRRVLQRDDIASYNDAVQALLDVQLINKDELNILVAHQNVLARTSTGEDERTLNENECVIGFSGEVNYKVFDAFDYVALGHIHAMQKIGRETVRYAGSPMQYDFSEEGRKKGYLLIDVQGKDAITITEKELPQLHRVMVLPQGEAAASKEELINLAKGITDKEDYYFKVRIWNTELVGNAQEDLYAAFGNTLLETEPVRKGASNYAITNAKGSSGRTLEENFAHFYKDRTKLELDATSQLVLNKVLKQQQNDGYIANIGTLKEQEAYKLNAFEELLNILEDVLEEGK